MTAHYLRHTCLVATMLTVLAASSVGLAQDTTLANTTNLASRLDVGSSMAFPFATTTPLNELMTQTVGSVSDSAVGRYGADFDAYYQASRTSREGKALEAITADLVNHRNAATGVGNRWITSASIGHPSHAADIVELDSSGKVIRQIQAGKGFTNVLSKLSDSKYDGMDILTDQDTYDSLRAELQHEVTRARALRKLLNPKFVSLRNAINQGRLLDRLPCGAPLPTQGHIASVARSHAQALYDSKLATRTARLAKISVNAVDHVDDATKALPTIAKHSRRLVRAVPVVAAGFEAVQGYAEISTTETQFASGQISNQQREVQHARTAGRIGGGIAGAAVGAKTLATFGGMVGSVGGPVGTGVGIGVGGLVGGIGGAIGGEKILSAGAEAATNALHSAGYGISASASVAWGWTRNGVNSAWNWVTGD